MKTSRRQFLAGTSAAAASIAMPSVLWAQTQPIILGHLTPRTGFLGPLGEYAVMAIDLAVEEINAKGGIKGRKENSEQVSHIVDTLVFLH